jgi:hypothetical protein
VDIVLQSVIPALRRWRQEEGELENRLGHVVRPWLKKKKEKKEA